MTEILCIIDKSGSMHDIKTDAIGGFNSFLEEQQKLPHPARLTLVLFNHDYELVHQGVDLQSVPPLDENSYVPSGTTALLDAVGRTIDDEGKRFAGMPFGLRPQKVIVAILTDGLENASKDYTRDRIFEMIGHQREEYGWEFIFLAANQDAIATGKDLNIQAADAVSFDATGEGVQMAYATLNERSARYRTGN